MLVKSWISIKRVISAEQKLGPHNSDKMLTVPAATGATSALGGRGGVRGGSNASFGSSRPLFGSGTLNLLLFEPLELSAMVGRLQTPFPQFPAAPSSLCALSSTKGNARKCIHC